MNELTRENPEAEKKTTTSKKKRGPYKARKQRTAEVSSEAPIERAPSRPAEMQSRNTQRPERVPMGQGQKLVAPERLGYQRYWAIDRDGELDSFIAAWWTFVEDSDGNKIKKPAGKGFTHYLMEIDQETYDQDMAKQQEMVTDALRKTTVRDSDEYVPMGHEDVLTRDKI
jgi:hypothetical protein